jgi:heat shock protein HtpX
MPIFLAIIPLILAPIAATMLKAAVSRKRESLADATAVSFTRNPAGLRAALEVLARDNTVVEARSSAVAHLYIESPLDASVASKLFATHPPIQERIETLRRMEANPNLS